MRDDVKSGAAFCAAATFELVDADVSPAARNAAAEAFGRGCAARRALGASLGAQRLAAAFGDAEAAVECAMSLQAAFEALRANHVDAPRFRAGVSIGTVLLRSADVTEITAPPICLAAQPGEICISAEVFEAVRNRLPYGYEYLGPRRLGDLIEPVETFAVRQDAGAASATPGKRPDHVPDPVDNLQTAVSVVVLPFASVGGDEDGNWLADGLTGDVTALISRFRNLFVIARASAFLFRDSTEGPSAIAKRLGARYAVDGVVRRNGRRLKVRCQLLDAENGEEVWGGRWSCDVDDAFDLQDEITDMIVAGAAVKIEERARVRAATARPADMRAYAYVLRGQERLQRYTPLDNREATRFYDVALDLAPGFARALAAKSRTRNIAWRYGWVTDRDKALDEALDLALQAAELDPMDARGFGEVGFARLYRKEHGEALEAYARARALNPNDADLLADMADALAHCERSEEAITLFQRAMKLNPFFPDRYLWELGGAFFNLARYEEAVGALLRMQNPTEGRRLLAACCALMGDMEAARAHAARVLEAHPDFSLKVWANVQPDRDSEATQRFIDGLAKAGLG